MQLHDASNASDVNHLYDVTHHVVVVHMTNDKCPTMTLEHIRGPVRFFVSRQKMLPMLKCKLASAKCLLPMLGYLMHHLHWSQHSLHDGLNVCFQHWTQHSTHRVKVQLHDGSNVGSKRLGQYGANAGANVGGAGC